MRSSQVDKRLTIVGVQWRGRLLDRLEASEPFALCESLQVAWCRNLGLPRCSVAFSLSGKVTQRILITLWVLLAQVDDNFPRLLVLDHPVGVPRLDKELECGGATKPLRSVLRLYDAST